MAALGVVDRALDGTPLYAARGELPVDVVEQRVQCHLCGGWYRALGSSHLWRTHGVTADEYRDLLSLHARPAVGPDLIDAQRLRLQARLVAEPRLRAAMAKGHALARRGELQREATSRLAQRPTSLERERQLGAAGARLGTGRAASFRRRRELRAVALGFAGLAGYYRRRYDNKRGRLNELAAALGWAESAVRGDLQRLGLGHEPGRVHTARARLPIVEFRTAGASVAAAVRVRVGALEELGECVYPAPRPSPLRRARAC